jgi:Zn-dependent peptidase ImmA (M78 family)
MRPRRLKVGAHIYKIRWKKMGLKKDHGETDTNKSEILINTSLSKSQQQITLVHELLHAILENCPHVSDTDPEELVEVSEEQIVTYQAPLLTNLLKDNIDLINFIVGD